MYQSPLSTLEKDILLRVMSESIDPIFMVTETHQIELLKIRIHIDDPRVNTIAFTRLTQRRELFLNDTMLRKQKEERLIISMGEGTYQLT